METRKKHASHTQSLKGTAMAELNLTPLQRAQIRADYEAWSGGFPPYSEADVITYVDTSLGVEVAEAQARDWLLTQVGGWTDGGNGRALAKLFDQCVAKIHSLGQQATADSFSLSRKRLHRLTRVALFLQKQLS